MCIKTKNHNLGPEAEIVNGHHKFEQRDVSPEMR
jgi:hypothetical protein